MKTNYIIQYRTANNLKGYHKFADFRDAKKVYVALVENLTIKSAKLYRVDGKRVKLIEKFVKKKSTEQMGQRYE